MTDRVRRILALREAGETERAHGTPHHGEYSIAKHCYNMACMAMELFDGEREEDRDKPIGDRGTLAWNQLMLLEAILVHDFAERWCGDPPAPVKWHHPELKEAMAIATDNTHKVFGIPRPELPEGLRWWVRALDIGELYLWTCDQRAMGNTHVEQMSCACTNWIHENRGMLPAPFLGWWDALHDDGNHRFAYRRLEDEPWKKT